MGVTAQPFLLEVRRVAIQKYNPVGLLAGSLGLLALLHWPALGLQVHWLLFKPNRIVAGEPFSAWALAPLGAWLLLGLWLALLLCSVLALPGRPWYIVALASAALLAALWLMRVGNLLLLQEVSNPERARISLRGGLWLSALAYAVALFAALHDMRPRPGHYPSQKLWRWLLALPGIAVLLFAGGAGWFADLGIAREFANQGRGLRNELLRHISLASTSVLLAMAVAVPAAIAAARREAIARLVLPTASFLQTLPSLALFGLMLAPLAQLGQVLLLWQALLLIVATSVLALALLLLSARDLFPSRWLRYGLRYIALRLLLLPLLLALLLLAVGLNNWIFSLLQGDIAALLPRLRLEASLAELGVRGIGAAPALIALTLYALLPIVRNSYTGLKEVPKAALEAGEGMGMSHQQLLWRVELPLAMPLIVEGVRASAVLTIGITTVAFLIGAGGLGTFIEQGISQQVPDLILLGALPIIGLALVADSGLRALGLLLTSKGLRR